MSDALPSEVSAVAMEATGVNWQPVWHILEDDLELTLCNARHVKHPGREPEVSDAQRLARLMEAGLLRASFVPPKAQRQLRTLTRYRKTQIAERQREVNQPHKASEDTNIKLDYVATDILGMSGRCSTRWFAGPPIPRCSPISRWESFPPCVERSRAALRPTTRWRSARSSRTSTPR